MADEPKIMALNGLFAVVLYVGSRGYGQMPIMICWLRWLGMIRYVCVARMLFPILSLNFFGGGLMHDLQPICNL